MKTGVAPRAEPADPAATHKSAQSWVMLPLRRQPDVSGQWDGVIREGKCRARSRTLASWAPRRFRRFGRALAGWGGIAHWRGGADDPEYRGHSPAGAASEAARGHSA